MTTVEATEVRTYGNLIAGDWQAATAGETFDSINPARRHDVLGHFAKGGVRDIDLAVRAAVAAQLEWARTPVPARAEVVARAGRILEERKEELAQLMTREMGKVLTEARGDVQEGIDMAKYMAGQGRNPVGEVVPSELRNKRAFTERVPIGVVGCITPWNFPLAIPCWKLMPALLAGNAVVFKPAEDTPLLAIKLAEVLIEAGLPKGVLGLVTGFGEDAGAALVAHPQVRAISFTGSVAVGQQIAASCGRLGKRVSLELGGKNAMLVSADADLELALEGALWGAFGTTGQRCTATSRLIVNREVLQPFSDELVRRAGKLRLGDGLEPTTDVGPVINPTQLQRIHGYTEVGRRESARLLTGGSIAAEGALAEGNFYQPTIFGDVGRGHAHRPGGNLRSHGGDHSRRRFRGVDPGSPTALATGSPSPSTPRTLTGRSTRSTGSMPASSTSTHQPSELRSSYPSAAPSGPGTGTGRREPPPSTSSPSGSRSTSITRATSSGPRSTPTLADRT